VIICYPMIEQLLPALLVKGLDPRGVNLSGWAEIFT